jgi:hypothetical protein
VWTGRSQLGVQDETDDVGALLGAQPLHVSEGRLPIDHPIEVLEMIRASFVIVDRLGLYEPQGDVAACYGHRAKDLSRGSPGPQAPVCWSEEIGSYRVLHMRVTLFGYSGDHVARGSDTVPSQ